MTTFFYRHPFRVIAGKGDETGFTLMELLMVIAIITIAMSVAIPNLLPAIVASEFESAARHIASYGRGAIAHCALNQERLTIHIDLRAQEYWAMTVPSEASVFFLGEGEGESAEKKNLEDSDEGSGESMDAFALLEAKMTGGDYDEEKVKKKRKKALSEFDRFVAASLIDRAKFVKHDEGMLSEIGPDLDEVFTDLNTEAEVKEPTEVTDPMLERTRLIEDEYAREESIQIESVEVGNNTYSDEEVEIEVTPMGMKENITIYLRDQDGEYMTVVWDAISGDSHVYDGKETSV